MKMPRNDEERYIHYGSSHFENGRYNIPEDLVYSNKPRGGFWACSCNAVNSWKKWCIDNDFHRKCDDRVSFYFRIFPIANILTIATLEDCQKLPIRCTELMLKKVIDYKACLEQGIDAIEYKYDLACESDEFDAIDDVMWGWDCDSILILNPAIILPYEPVDAEERI